MSATKLLPNVQTTEAGYQAARLRGLRTVYAKTVSELQAGCARVGVACTREMALKALERSIPGIREILGETH